MSGSGDWLKRHGKWFIIFPPLAFLFVFFLIPFAYAFRISLADMALRMPPYTDILSVSRDAHINLSLNLGNFKYLFTDEVYGLSYLYSLKTAFFSTLICLALGGHKASIVERVLRGPVGPACPATVLRGQPHAVLLLDEPCAALI